MLLIIFLGLIDKLTSVSGDWDFGTREVDDFDWTKVDVSVFTGFLQEAAVETSTWFYILFLVLLTKTQYSISDSLIYSCWMIHG